MLILFDSFYIYRRLFISFSVFFSLILFWRAFFSLILSPQWQYWTKKKWWQNRLYTFYESHMTIFFVVIHLCKYKNRNRFLCGYSVLLLLLILNYIWLIGCWYSKIQTHAHIIQLVEVPDIKGRTVMKGF
jgi:hypothetical protein